MTAGRFLVDHTTIFPLHERRAIVARQKRLGALCAVADEERAKHRGEGFSISD
jgi:hypothetical protein